MLSVSCPKQVFWNAVKLHVDLIWQQVIPRVGSALLLSPGQIHFPPGRSWFSGGFSGYGACLLLQQCWAVNSSTSNFFCLTHLVHAASGFVKKQLWRNCWYLEDLWLDVLIALQLQDSWFIITNVTYWWLQGSDSGKQLNALLHLCLFKKPSKQIVHIKQTWGWGHLPEHGNQGCHASLLAVEPVSLQREETWILVLGRWVHRECCDPGGHTGRLFRI